MRETEAIADARRAMEVCNACRYCEGFCAVFPAMELKREFSAPDLSYLANLCHGCNGCFYACQYAPPHEFGINLPKHFAEIRAESYADYAWPRGLAKLFDRNGTVVSLIAAGAVSLILALAGLLQAPGIFFAAHSGPGAFYAVIPYPAMAWIGSLLFLYALVALAMGVRNFWRDTGGRTPGVTALMRALHDAATLKNLGNSGDGCNYPDESFSQLRRRLHHAMMYGFLLCFAATSVATIDHHWLAWIAPYPFFSLPVILGTLGGLGMIVGATGLIWLKVVSDPAPTPRALLGSGYALLILLLLVAVTGLVLLILRDTAAMGTLLAVHLGLILALFLVIPYSKFVHGLYRATALVRSRMEGH